MQPKSELTHLDEQGRARMVDVSAKEITSRTAIARGSIHMRVETLALILEDKIEKGDVFSVARVAGIMGAKRTPDLIPLCHPIALHGVTLDLTLGESSVDIEVAVKTADRTGVEMEALTACAVAALTIYDMCKSVDRGMTIGELALWEKTGGRSGVWRREGRSDNDIFGL